MRKCLFWLVSGMPALTAAAVGIYLYDVSPVWEPTTLGQACTFALLLACATAVPLRWIRIACLVLLAGFIFLSGFSIGLFYLPTLFFTFLAVVLPVNRPEARPVS